MDKQTKRVADLIFSCIPLAFVLTILISSTGLHPDTRRLPVLIAWYTLFFILWNNAIQIRDYLRAKKNPGADDGKKSKPVPVKKIVVSVILMAFLLISWRVIGFLAGSILVTVAYVYYLKERRPLALIVTPVVVTLALYFMFSKFLMVPLPSGLF